MDLERVHTAVLDWYAVQGRDLPWRRTRDPYAILVAEIMLQQTQVERVLPKWHAWLERFPTLTDLAAAPRAEAIRAWQGLGYNLRAVRLHAIAVQATAEFGGSLPRRTDQLMRLKGVGRYTAGAVACFAYEQPVAMVDTNVRRVLGRVFQLSDEKVDAFASSALPAQAAYPWNQALMDLGATVCRAQHPLCLLCPLLEWCGGPTPPRARSSRRAEPFEESTRYRRGRIVDRLRRLGPGERAPVAELLSLTGADAETIHHMAAEGLVEIDSEGLA